jgi:hypothetical protein
MWVIIRQACHAQIYSQPAVPIHPADGEKHFCSHIGYTQEEKDRKPRYKAILVAKNAQYGGSTQILLCKRCYELHVRCPGLGVDANGDWDYSKKCLRCEEHRQDVVCDFFADRTRV